MFIYVITNSATGKIYIGQHKGNNLMQYLQKKFYDAKKGRGGTSLLYNSMRKHPKEVWSIEPLFEGIDTKEELDRLEKLFIALYDTRNPEIGYNISRGGEGGGQFSLEGQANLIKALKKRWSTPGFKEYWKSIMTGHPTSDETKDKIKTARALQDESSRVEGCRKYAADHPEEMSTRMSREVHSLGGKAGSREAKQRAARISIEGGSYIKAQHTRWHINRGLKKLGCAFCN